MRASLVPGFPCWGLHLADVNIALGDLIDLVGSETKAYLRRNR